MQSALVTATLTTDDHSAVTLKNNTQIVSDSNRTEDIFNYLTVENCILTGEDVARYFGKEIPRYKEFNLNPDQIYMVYRPAAEIRDSNFDRKPLLSQHMDFSAIDYKSKFIVGTVGATEMKNDKLTATLEFWSQKAIDELNKGQKYLSCGYTYTPKVEKGVYNGISYDIMMTDIKANHVAMVDNPRYKAAVVADEAFSLNKLLKGIKTMNFLSKFRKLVHDEDTMSFDAAIEATKAIMSNDSLEEDDKEKAIKELKEKGKKSEAADKTAKDEELKAKMQKETELAGDEDDENEKDIKKKADVKDSDCGKVMDSDSIETLIEARVKAELQKITKQSIVFDSAIEEYKRTCGQVNKLAFDSADSVLDAILKNNRINATGKTLEQKQAMVEMLPSVKKQSANMVFDSNTTGKKLIPDNLATFLKGK